MVVRKRNRTTFEPKRCQWVHKLRVPENISARIPDGVELQFEFAVTGSIPPSPITAVSVEQTVHMSLIVDQPKAITFFSPLCTRICDFLSLALDQPVTINAVNGFPGASSSMASNDAQRVDLYGRFSPWTEAAATIRVNNILFRYGGIGNRLDEVLGRWLKAYDSLGPAIHLYFACRTKPTQFIDFKVLWLIQALESWHRRSSDEVAIERAEFKQLMMTLTEACPDDKRNWLKERLQHAYELSLSARLHILIDPFERWFGNTQSRKQFVRRVVDTRNYLTHYSSESKRGAAQGIDLLPLYAKLEALFQLQLLRLVGFSDAVIDEVVRDNQRLSNSLRR